MHLPRLALAIATSLLVALAACSEDDSRVIRRVRDFNGDGFDDLAVGAISNSDGASDGGAVYVYFGGAAVDSALRSAADATLLGRREKGKLGASLTRVGDLNGDGLADLLVGAPGGSEGLAYVYFGNPGEVFDATPDGILGEGQSIVSFGSSVAGAGDVNGDGFDDVIVGALHDGSGGHLAGSARIYLGGPGTTFDPIPDVTLYGEPDEYFGWAVAGVSDVNGDGFEDVLVSSPFHGAGRVRLYLGATHFDDEPDATFQGEVAGDQFGFAIAGAADLNGDRIPDLAISAPLASDNPQRMSEAGRVYFYFGGGGGPFDTMPDAHISGHRTKEHLGRAVALVGDLNGDRFADAVITAPHIEEGDATHSEVRIIFGAKQFAANLTAAIFQPIEGFGESVTAAGDLNHDGFSDLILAAPEGKSVYGAAIYFGAKGPSFEPYRDLTLYSPKNEELIVR